MKHRLTLLILIFTISLIGSENGYHINKEGYAFLPFDKKTSVEYGEILNYKQIYKWGLSNSLYVKPDKKPFIDNHACFLTGENIFIDFKGLSPSQKYYLIIDFVAYNAKKSFINSRLKIYADSNLIEEMRWGEQNNKQVVIIELPSELTYDGIVKIEMIEFSVVKGFWGIWDIALTTGKIPNTKKKNSPVIELRKYILDRKSKFRKKDETTENGEFDIKEPTGPVFQKN